MTLPKQQQDLMFYQVLLLPNIHLRDGFMSCTLSFKQNSIHVIPKTASALLKNSAPLNKLGFPPLPSYHPFRAARTRMNTAFIPIATGSSRLLIKLGETAGGGEGGCTSTLPLTKWMLPSQ